MWFSQHHVQNQCRRPGARRHAEMGPPLLHEICHEICSLQPTHAAHDVAHRWQNQTHHLCSRAHRRADPLDKDAFWSQLDLHVSRLSNTTSLICVDANATVGSVVCDSIGPVAPLQESENGTFLRSLLSSHRLVAFDTFIDGSPTRIDALGHARRIDYIAIPIVLVPSVKECLVDRNINLSPAFRADYELLRVFFSYLPSQSRNIG